MNAPALSGSSSIALLRSSTACSIAAQTVIGRPSVLIGRGALGVEPDGFVEIVDGAVELPHPHQQAAAVLVGAGPGGKQANRACRSRRAPARFAPAGHATAPRKLIGFRQLGIELDRPVQVGQGQLRRGPGRNRRCLGRRRPASALASSRIASL